MNNTPTRFQSDYPLCLNVLTFLQAAPRNTAFKAQNWLGTLDDTVVAHIEQGAYV